jgi:hypothetical protein
MDFDFSETEKEAVISWLALRDAAHYFNRIIPNFPAFTRTNEAINKEVANHKYAHGALVCVGVPAELVFETIDQAGNVDTLRLFRMVCAVRSIIGNKTTAGTTKDFIRARMIGAKTPAIAAKLLMANKEIRSEHKLMKSRKRIDRILMEGAIRKFYGKLGTGRRVHLSLEIKEPAQLKATIKTKMARRKEYALAEQLARDTKGQQQGSNRGTIGGSLNKTLNKDLETKTCKDEVHQGCTDITSLPF